MEIVAILLSLVALLSLSGVSKRVKAIENFVNHTQERKPTPNVKTGTTSQAPEAAPQVPISKTKPGAGDYFIEWLKDDWLLKLGAMLILIGFGWFVSYAFLNNWIGPIGRITFGIIAGLAVLLLGWWRIKKFVRQGSIFLVLGAAIILLTIYAAREVYDMIHPVVALGVMFLSVVFVALASVKYKSQGLALSGLALAGIAPFLVSNPRPDFTGLFLYLLIINLGVIWVVTITGWRILINFSLLLAFFYSIPHLLASTDASAEVLVLIIYGLAFALFAAHTLGILKTNDPKEALSDLITAAGNGLLIIAWTMTAVPDNWQSLTLSLWLIVYGVGAFLMYKFTHSSKPFFVYSGISVAVLAAATAAELNGAALTIAYTIESAGVAILTYIISQNLQLAIRSSLLLIGPAILSLGSLIRYVDTYQVLNRDFFVLFIVGVTGLGLGSYFWLKVRAGAEKIPTNGPIALVIIGSAYLHTLLWFLLKKIMSEDASTTLALTIYTILGLALYIYGQTNRRRVMKMYGGTLSGLVVARLIIVDVWTMAIAGKIVTFFLIGALLVGTAFINYHKKPSK